MSHKKDMLLHVHDNSMQLGRPWPSVEYMMSIQGLINSPAINLLQAPASSRPTHPHRPVATLWPPVTDTVHSTAAPLPSSTPAPPLLWQPSPPVPAETETAGAVKPTPCLPVPWKPPNPTDCFAPQDLPASRREQKHAATCGSGHSLRPGKSKDAFPAPAA